MMLEPEGMEPSAATRMDLSPKQEKKSPVQAPRRPLMLSESSMRELRASVRVELPNDEQSKEVDWLLDVFDPEVLNMSQSFDEE